jgi:TPR repeat protein/F0F1-type ATP synthase assembly protein I
MDDEPTMLCPDCHGKWQLEDMGPCETCNGSGKVECDFCKGAGELDVTSICKQFIDIKSDSYIKIDKDHLTVTIVSVIKDAADNRVGLADYVMGQLCYSGLKIDGKVVVEEDSEKAMEYWRIGAEADDPIAQGAYGLWLCIGCGSKKPDVAAGLPWLVKAGKNGNIESLYLLAIDGFIYGEYGHKRDLSKSLECFNAILSAKDRDAWYQGYVKSAEGYVRYLPGIIDNDTKAMLSLAEWMKKDEGYVSRDFTAGGFCCEDDVYWIEQAAKCGDISAMLQIAKWYADQNNEVYKSRSKGWYQKAANKGDPVAMSILGQCLRNGDGMEKDARRAFIYLYQAAEKGNIVALRYLAHLYRDGSYVGKSREKANELYTRAAKAGDPWGLYEIGRCYLNGDCVRKNEVEAKRLLKIAAEKVNKAKEALSSIPSSVKDKETGPSGIIVGVPDESPLPKFAKTDYEKAVEGKEGASASGQNRKSVATSAKKRWKFVVLGLLLGFIGAHFAYAKRWFLFLLLWAGLITGGVMSGGDQSSAGEVTDAAAVQTENAEKKESSSPIGGIGFAVWALLWIGGALFVKKDGKGNRM